ncbi:type II secretion system protein [Acidovorax sp. MR-S7]|uniref:type II secretion system protein n=1 Tax=Acidovorax sp. MR-S7 TaxID=1268622 RepID=UPI0003D3F2F6|nr:type II secretion system protein [Acidovorax sp. MR-S7]GAD22848.1 hypothetical protein AVS7_02608 [Acidovorax sp. MR-S7]
MLTFRRQKGFGLLHILSALVVLIALSVGFNVYKTNQRKAEVARQELQRQQEAEKKALRVKQLNEHKDKVLSMLRKWDDALNLAGMTSRIALAQPISQMQAVRREVGEFKFNECFDKSTSAMETAMGKAIFAFEMFVRFPNNHSASETTSEYLADSAKRLASARSDLDRCVDTGASD